MHRQALLAEARKLLKEWERNAKSNDLMHEDQWVRGVVYGMRLMFRLLFAPGNKH